LTRTSFNVFITSSRISETDCCSIGVPEFAVFGEIYWYSLYPIHLLIFKELVTAMRRRAESATAAVTEEAIA
jgi:hypothetical protein